MSNELNDVRMRLCTYRSEEDLPEELQGALQQRADLRQYWEESRRVATLIGLKQYETPADLNLLRCRTSVRRTLLARENRVGEGWWTGWFASPAALFRFGFATALLGFMALYLFAPAHIPEIVPSSQPFVAAEPAPPPPTLVAGERPNPEFTPMALSNWMPRVQQPGPFQLIGHER